MASPRPSNTAYDEVSQSIFSMNDFSWREVKVRAAPSLPPAKKAAGQHGGDAVRNAGRAGGFSYSGSALGHSTCRNRFILW